MKTQAQLRKRSKRVNCASIFAGNGVEFSSFEFQEMEHSCRIKVLPTATNIPVSNAVAEALRSWEVGISCSKVLEGVN